MPEMKWVAKWMVMDGEMGEVSVVRIVKLRACSEDYLETGD